MPSQLTSFTAWHVKAPDGKVCVWTASFTERAAKEKLLDGHNWLWKYAKAQGYELVPYQVVR